MWSFFRRHPHILLFGILQIFFSAPGQTFLIALFVGPIFKELSISQSLFAGLYSAATLSAALLLNPAGRLIDRYYIHTIVKTVTVAMALGCALLASATNVWTVFIAFFILRLIGQGVYGLCASTLMIKSFHRNRGKAMGIMTLGFPLSEAVYPGLAMLLLNSVGWRNSYLVFGAVNIVLMLPLQLFLLRRASIVHGQFQAGELDVNPQHLRGRPEHRKVRPHRDVPLHEVIRDIKFYLMIVASCLPPMIVTGLFFHQNTLFEAHGWNMSLAAGGLMIYAFCKAAGSIWIGQVVDRYGPMLPFSGLIFLLGLGTLLAGAGGPPAQIYLFFGLIGAALGFSSPVTNVVFPYFYGTKHMGSIKGLVATYRNGLTALGPLPVAVALDAGITIQSVLCITAAGVLVLSALPWLIFRLDRSGQLSD
ncbi:MAG: MFS transporter [Candidatus Omnitrophica bacterium]|nr:MFS transporter [Candidatus Omnitrophota bacterium]MCB9722086.1 MFS transporter [Candidatus Omnitrophota bacterium]